jgi:hypothetical protein
MRFRIEHPTAAHVSAVYSFDAGMRGYFVEVLRGRKVTKTYDPLTAGYAVARPLWGALVFLVVEGFFTESELHDALLALAMPSSTRCAAPSGAWRRSSRTSKPHRTDRGCSGNLGLRDGDRRRERPHEAPENKPVGDDRSRGI